MITRIFHVLVLFALVPGAAGVARAQPDQTPVVMNLAAHPDDEDGSTLTYYRRAKDALAYSVIFTRGEGGQNEIGPELYEALGALRTAETERAARTLGTQVFFLNFYDFGYSKTASEAFAAWGGRDKVTARLVYLIRKLKPDVLFTNHDTVTVGPRRQHGQHQAVGLAAYDAIALAADSAFHPEQLGEPGIDLWQPKRLFLRHGREPEQYDVAVPVSDVYAPAGKSYTDLAMEALREHASQGMGMFASWRRPAATYFTLLRSATPAPLDPVDLAGNLSPNEAAQPDLAYRIDAGRAPTLPAGALTLDDSVAVPGQTVQLRWDAAALPAPRVRWVLTGAVDTTFTTSDVLPEPLRLRVAPQATPTLPKATYQYERFVSHPPVTYALYRPSSQDLLAAGYLPLEVAPPALVEAEADVVRLRPGTNPLPIRVQAFDPAARTLALNVAVSRDADRSVLFQEQRALALGPGGTARDTLQLALPTGLPRGDYTVTLTGVAAPATATPAPARDQLAGRVFDVAVAPGLRVGVVQSYDDTLPRALEELGVAYALLDSAALASGRLDSLPTILVDIRAYLVRPDLRRHNDRLLDWVQRGGHLIVNYQKTFEWNDDQADPFAAGQNNPGDFAPYPIHLSRDRVTREDAPVTVLVPDHPLFRRPNEIGPAAWEGWVQERGLYFPREYAPQYQELLSLHDPGEAPLRGSTLLASYGDGTYLYTAIVWYRQLKDFNPGAYAVFANLISLPLADGPSGATTAR
jgi:LmbE family N-acetylglucosaminyl deacetylase